MLHYSGNIPRHPLMVQAAERESKSSPEAPGNDSPPSSSSSSDVKPPEEEEESAAEEKDDGTPTEERTVVRHCDICGRYATSY